MDKQRKSVVSGALYVAGEALKLGLGLGVLGVSKIGSLVRGAISNSNEVVKSASTTVGGGISDAKQATGHVAEAAEALIVEFGHTFQGQAGAPADVKEEPVAVEVTVAAKAIKPVRKTAAKKSPAAKTASAAKLTIDKAAASPAKAKAATKAKAPLKVKVKAAFDETGKPAGTVAAAKGSDFTSATAVAVPKPAAIKKAAAKKPAAKTAARKPKTATTGAELAQLAEQTPPPNKLH